MIKSVVLEPDCLGPNPGSTTYQLTLDKLCAYPKVLFWRLNRLVSIQELPNELDKWTYKSLMQLLTCSWYEFCKFCLNFCLYQGKVLTIIVIILDTFSFYSCKQEGYLTWKICSNLDFLVLINIITQFTIIRILISFRSDRLLFFLVSQRWKSCSTIWLFRVFLQPYKQYSEGSFFF